MLHILFLVFLCYLSGADSSLLPECRLCSGQGPCLPKGIKGSSELKFVDLSRRSNQFAVTISISIDEPGWRNETEENCFLKIRKTSLHGKTSTLNITTRGKEDRNGCWFAKKSINIDSNRQIFINYKGNCSLNDELVGRYEVVLKDNDTVDFFVAASPKVDRAKAEEVECEITNSTCLSLQRKSVNLSRCLETKGGKAILETCDGETVKQDDDRNVVRTDNNTLKLFAECSDNLTVSCFVDGISKEVARVNVIIVEPTDDGETSSDVVRSPENVSSTTGVAVACVLVLLLIAILAAVTVKRGYFK